MQKWYCTLFCRTIRDQLVQETGSVALAREFLRKQKHSLRQRQAALQAAKKELDQDIVRQQLGVSHFLTYSLKKKKIRKILKDRHRFGLKMPLVRFFNFNLFCQEYIARSLLNFC